MTTKNHRQSLCCYKSIGLQCSLQVYIVLDICFSHLTLGFTCHLCQISTACSLMKGGCRLAIRPGERANFRRLRNLETTGAKFARCIRTKTAKSCKIKVQKLWPMRSNAFPLKPLLMLGLLNFAGNLFICWILYLIHLGRDDVCWFARRCWKLWILCRKLKRDA